MSNTTTNRFFALLVSFICIASTLRAQVCQWVKQSEGNYADNALSCVVDAAGNTYVAGTFNGLRLAFGSTILINPAGAINNPSAFLVKYDSLGNLIWAKLLGAGERNAANSIAIDAAGNLYVYGNFYNPTVTFGMTTLTNMSNYDDFLVKLDSSGTPIWARSEQETENLTGRDAIGIVADNSGHIVVTGAYGISISIGSITVASSGGAGGIFVAQYDTAGIALWASTSDGPGIGAPTAIAVDGSDNIYIAGNFTSATLSFDGSVIPNVKGEDLFVAKYNSAGIAQWARDIPDSGRSRIVDIDADNAGNLYIAGGFFDSTIIFGATTLTNEAHGTFGGNAFVVQYNTAGDVNWAHKGGGTTVDAAQTVDVSPFGYVVVSGTSSSEPSTFDGDTLAEPGMFMVTYTPSGALRSLSGASTPNEAEASSMTHDAAGNVYCTGYFYDSFDANGHTVTDTSVSNADELFTARFTNATLGVKTVQPLQHLSIFPNPAITQLIVASTTAPLSTIVITDMQGGEVYSYTGGNVTQLAVNIALYPAGMYLIRINGTEVRKFVKE